MSFCPCFLSWQRNEVVVVLGCVLSVENGLILGMFSLKWEQGMLSVCIVSFDDETSTNPH